MRHLSGTNQNHDNESERGRHAQHNNNNNNDDDDDQIANKNVGGSNTPGHFLAVSPRGKNVVVDLVVVRAGTPGPIDRQARRALLFRRLVPHVHVLRTGPAVLSPSRRRQRQRSRAGVRAVRSVRCGRAKKSAGHGHAVRVQGASGRLQEGIQDMGGFRDPGVWVRAPVGRSGPGGIGQQGRQGAGLFAGRVGGAECPRGLAAGRRVEWGMVTSTAQNRIASKIERNRIENETK
mmetsp:Transcript_25793/g.53855  ORF Transcript_25793/g.53855 Transcript_25793/m.53855 type:complete len:234 (-) Transcript_25793:41-742(-)